MLTFVKHFARVSLTRRLAAFGAMAFINLFFSFFISRSSAKAGSIAARIKENEALLCISRAGTTAQPHNKIDILSLPFKNHTTYMSIRITALHQR